MPFGEMIGIVGSKTFYTLKTKVVLAQFLLNPVHSFLRGSDLTLTLVLLKKYLKQMSQKLKWNMLPLSGLGLL